MVAGDRIARAGVSDDDMASLRPTPSLQPFQSSSYPKAPRRAVVTRQMILDIEFTQHYVGNGKTYTRPSSILQLPEEWDAEKIYTRDENVSSSVLIGRMHALRLDAAQR